MIRSFRHTKFRVAGLFTIVIVAAIALPPAPAQRPPVPPRGANPNNQPGNPPENQPSNPVRPIAPSSPGSNPGGKHGIVAARGPSAPGRAGAGDFEKIWRCSNCNEELGRGPDKPNLATCPRCGVEFDPDYAPKVATNNSSYTSVPPIGLLGFACIGFLVAVVVIVVLIKWVLG